MSNFDVNWLYGHVTNRGHTARILATDVKSIDEQPIVAAVVMGDTENIFQFMADGRSKYISDFWLLNKPAPVKELYCSVGLSIFGDVVTSPLVDSAQKCGNDANMGIIKLTITNNKINKIELVK